MKKRAVSSVVATVAIILLTMVLVAIVFKGVSSIIRKKMENYDSCEGIRDNLILEDLYTCYNKTSNEMDFSVSIKDISIKKIYVSVRGKGMSKGFEISNSPKAYAYLKYIDGSYNSPVALPEKNAGKVYVIDLNNFGFAGVLDSIEIKPYVNNEECFSIKKDDIYECSKLKDFV